MEQKYVNEYLKYLSNLSDIELEKRDLYLRGLNLGEIYGPMTGNFYIDKPHTARFKKELPVEFNPYRTLYSAFAESVKGRENEIAIVQPDNERVITYGELLDEIDKTAAGLAREGLGEGSKLGLLFSNDINQGIFLLAASKIGAATKWIDYTKDPESIFLSVTETKIDMFVLEDMLKPVEAQINPTKIPTVICGNSGELADHHITYETLSEMGKSTHVEPVPFKEDRPAVIISSSGTTGEPKPITHSDLTVNFAVRRMLYSNYPLDNNHIVMMPIPPHIGLGLITTLYTNLISGAKIACIHSIGPEDSMHKTVEFLMRYNDYASRLFKNPDLRLVIFAAPIHVRMIASVDAVTDLSFLDGFLAAGSKLTKEELEPLQKVYAAKGCPVPVCNAYGRNEEAGAVAINDPAHNVNGAAGYPVIGTDILVVDQKTDQLLYPGVFDETTGELLTPEAEGVIYERSNSEFLYYLGMPEATEDAKIEYNGVEYYKTDDLGFFDQNGFLHITGRLGRVIFRFDMKISLDRLEGKVRAFPFVKDCAAVVTEFGGSFEKMTLFVEPAEGYSDLTSEEFMNRVMEKQAFSDIDKPDEIQIMPIPYMNNGKIDYQLLSGNKKSQARARKSGK